MRILTDIGGTHARFAVADAGGELAHFRKYKAEDFADLAEALNTYAQDEGLGNESCKLAIATAAYRDGDVWRFINRNQWVLDPAALKKRGREAVIILNDFEAATWAVHEVPKKDLLIFRENEVEGAELLPRCLLGPGTGLGLGFSVPLAGGGFYVQRTHGGHMPAAAVTDEQRMVLTLIPRLRGEEGFPVYEHVASGPGLFSIYRALCLMEGRAQDIEAAEDLLEHAGEEIVQKALGLFQEFLALFAQTAMIPGHAYGGLYLMGGMIDRLIEHKLFDYKRFEGSFCENPTISVRQDLEKTGIAAVRDPLFTMKGLLRAMEEKDRG